MEWCKIPCSQKELEEFWDCGSGMTMNDWCHAVFDHELAEDLVSVGVCFRFSCGRGGYMETGTVWQICKYWGLPVPAEAKPEGIRKLLNSKILGGWSLCATKWKDVLKRLPDDKDAEARNDQFWESVQNFIRSFERNVGLLEKIADALVPYVMHAYESKLEQARVRAVYDMVVLEKQLNSNFLHGFKAKVASFQ